MEASNGPSKNALLLMFGLPILQTAIICASMYAGHVLTKRMDRQQAAAKKVPATLQPAAIQFPIAATVVSATVAPASEQTPVAPVIAPVVASEPRLMAASSVAPSIKAVEKPEIASMNRAVERLTPATQAKVIEKPKAFVRSAQKPVMIPLIRSTEKPAAIPTPLLVPKKDTQKPMAVQIDADDPATQVHLRDSRPSPTMTAVQKPIQKTVPLDAPVVPAVVATAIAPAPATALPAPIVAAPTSPALHANPELAVVVDLPKVETGGDVAAAEPVRRAPVIAPKPVEPAPQPVQAVRPAPIASAAQAVAQNDIRGNEGRMILASSPVLPVPAAHSNLLLGRPVRDDDLSLDLLYALSAKYVDAYSAKKGLNPGDENKRWMKRWMDNVEQAMDDGDSSEQQYINRVTISKRDCFNIEKAAVDKVVEGCRILLRYRDGNFTWLSAMREALTRENLKKTLVFLNAGPQL